MQLNVLNDLAKAKRALDGKKQAAKFALGAPGWALVSAQCCIGSALTDLGMVIVWCGALCCFVCFLPYQHRGWCNAITFHRAGIVFVFFPSSLARSLQLALCLVCCFCCFFFFAFCGVGSVSLWLAPVKAVFCNPLLWRGMKFNSEIDNCSRQ